MSRKDRYRPLWHTTFQVLLLQVDSHSHVSSWSLGWVAYSLAPSSLASRSHNLVAIPNPPECMDIVISSPLRTDMGKVSDFYSILSYDLVVYACVCM